MSIASDGILAFGWNLGDDLDLGWLDPENSDIGDQIDKRLLAKLASFTEEFVPEINYWERRNAAKDNIGVELIIHCSYDYPMYFLSAKGSASYAYRGSPVTIEDLREKPKWSMQRLQTINNLPRQLNSHSPL